MKKQNSLIQQETAYGANISITFPVILTKGQGCWVWDIDGKKYLDMLSAYSALTHGHCHPRIVKVLSTQAARLSLSSRVFHNDQLGPFLQKICQLTGLDMAIPMNSGAEAVETAVKSARLWGYQVKKIPPNTAEIIVVNGNFHGRTTTVISFSTEELYKRDFGPLTPGFKWIPFGDAGALEKAITPRTCAFLVEPLQGESGIQIPPKGWLKEVEKICQKNQVLLIVDEIQTGLARTGKLFAFQHEDVRPDGVILGKALGGGMMPVSAFIGKREILSLYKPQMHGTTFGGNPLACAVAMEALRIIEEDGYVERSRELGNYLLEKLRKLNSPIFADIRGRGLFIGLEIRPEKIHAHTLCLKLMEKGILSKETHETVVRLAPPLIITREELDWALEVIQSAISEI